MFEGNPLYQIYFNITIKKNMKMIILIKMKTSFMTINGIQIVSKLN